MKTKGRQVGFFLVLGIGLLAFQAPRLGAQAIPGASVSSEEVHNQQLAAERDTLATMLDDGSTSEAIKGAIRRLLDWNTRGLTIAEVKRMQAQPLPVKAAPPPASVSNLTKDVVAPSPDNGSSNSSPTLQSPPKVHTAETSAKAASPLDLIKARLQMNSAVRESDAKVREAKPTQNKTGAVMLTQRPQVTTSVTSQQVNSVNVPLTGDTHRQSVPQSAKATGQPMGGGAVSAGARATGKQVIGGGGALPSAGGATAAPAVNKTSLAVGMETSPVSDMSAFKSTRNRYTPDSNELIPRPTGPIVSEPSPRAVPDEFSKAAKQLRGEALTPERRVVQPQNQPEADIPLGGGAVAPVTEEPKSWEQNCPLHGKFYGKGDVTTCPRCKRISARPGSGLVH